MTIDPRERELLAQLLGVTVVRLDIDRALEEECFVESVQLVLNGLRGSLGVRDLVTRGCFPRLPDLILLAECSIEGEWEGQVRFLPL